MLIGMVLFCAVQAQDVIFKKNGDEISAKILEVGVTEVKYKQFNNQDGPLYTILKTDIFMIKYANGTKEVFNSDASSSSVQTNNDGIAQPTNQEQATVIIYRKNSPSGFAVFYDVYANDKLITKVQNNTYYVTKQDAGLVTFSAMTEPPKVTASMNLEPGKTYYLKCGVNSGMWVGRPSIGFVSENTGILETSRMKK